ncbi:hypothetical protein DICPUDRAFT_41231 [Dictyostelium purpureum]|uniref:ABC transporter domain-containing protein n=1 Tax=Dictyostelium purpureum TaxID=5786 RepID=F0ZZM0_DICPU|nr:uncharacterized protein DICPUDRAFT_41231 [Dictyostelium purpureum]EGC30600.1 hypothetical protein DICPUDRAFT_41231 [Dictyostelium purpureum]|eukprot:XP_003292864.1 hypothetical protein DICPUDRAFT_41231 [Dictyostelium purpureum]
MVREFSGQLRTLLKKNYLIKKKNKCGVCFEIVLPIVIVLIIFALLGLISSVKPNYDSYNVSNILINRLNNNTILLYGAPETLNVEQQGVINIIKLQVEQSRKLQPNEVDSFFLEINDQTAMEEYFSNHSNSIYGAVWFNNSQVASKTVPFQYNIRLDSENVNNNNETTNKNGNSEIYLKGNFASIQVAVDQAIFEYYGINKTLVVSGQRYPDPYTKPWQKWIVVRNAILKDAGSVFVTAAFFIFGFCLVTDLVIEKETKIREGMKMMGLNDLAYFFSWIITSLTISLPVDLIIVTIFKGSQVIYSTPWGLVIATFVLYLLTLLFLAFIFAIFFDKSKFCGLISIIIILIINIAGVFIAKGDFNPNIKMFLSILSPIAFSCSFYTMVVRDIPEEVLSVNFNSLVTEKQAIYMLIIDLFFYLFLIWYLQEVVPTEYGTKKPFYFIFSPKYWCSIGSNSNIYDIESTYQNDDVELIPNDIKSKVTISIRNLRKEFSTGDGIRVAVNDLYLDMYENQIHAFLGPNGSGKSTTIGMLTGLISPTGGTALIQGYDIGSQMSKVRRSLGVCLQQDIIWNQLSVLEHLKIYGSLKGITKNVEKEAEKMAIEIGLGEKIHTPAGSLSGGQKRKLCLGIAFIGRSSVVFLDECTSGMDPLSRRSVWDFLLKYKKGRTIILTTHFMDEADFLGDRISIISYGKLRCDGSSLYLKNKFGCGYLLTCSKDINNLDYFSTSNVTEFVHRYIPEANILSDAGTELSYRLPTSSLPIFSQFFEDFDEQLSYFGITTYGISVTTMEEVFLKIGQEANSGNVGDIYQNTNSNINSEGEGSLLLKTGISTPSSGINAGQQIKGLLIKRIRTSIKDWKSLFLTLIIPLVCIICSIVIFVSMDSAQTYYNDVTTPLTMSLASFGANDVVPIQTISQEDFDTLNQSPFFNQFKYVNQSANFKNYLIENNLISAGAINVTTQLAQNNSVVGYNSFYNIKYLHSIPIHINLINSALLEHSTDIRIQITSMPFKHVLSMFDLSTEGLNISSILYFNIIMLAGLALMVGSFAGSISQERTNRVKRLLYISGCKKYVYWLSNLIWDYIFSFIIILATSIILAIAKEEFREQFGIFFLSLILYCVATIPLCYLLSYLFNTHGKATGAIAAILFAKAIVLMITSLNIRGQVLVNLNEGTQTAADICDIIFSLVSPLYAYSRILALVSKFPGTTRLGSWKIDNYWSLDYGGTPIIILIFHCIVWTSWILLLDYSPEIKGFFKNPKNLKSPPPPVYEDSDVSNERSRIHTVSDEIVKVDSLHKLFKGKGKNGDKIAVHNTCLGIPRGQTFGLLGLNGAGKTSTLSMLCGDIIPTSGQVSINGHDLISDRSKALQNISMCPQFDALVGLLSAREQLYLYCRIKGVAENNIENVVESFINMMDMSRIANSSSGGYSGGNKRKLSLSIAMLGDPSVVFLDEASTGCDAVVRRYIWNVISELSKGRSIIITTHSMEECQALCSRITIMKDGKFTCLGSIQHVKNKFGAGYSFDVKFKREYFENGVETVLHNFPNARLLDQHDLIASFELPNEASNPVKVSRIFNTLQNDLGSILDDYSVSQTSLEQVFLKLTGASYDDRLNQNAQNHDQ